MHAFLEFLSSLWNGWLIWKATVGSPVFLIRVFQHLKEIWVPFTILYLFYTYFILYLFYTYFILINWLWKAPWGRANKVCMYVCTWEISAIWLA